MRQNYYIRLFKHSINYSYTTGLRISSLFGTIYLASMSSSMTLWWMNSSSPGEIRLQVYSPLPRPPPKTIKSSWAFSSMFYKYTLEPSKISCCQPEKMVEHPAIKLISKELTYANISYLSFNILDVRALNDSRDSTNSVSKGSFKPFSSSA